MSIGHILKNLNMEIPLLLFGPVRTIRHVNEVASYIILSKSLS